MELAKYKACICEGSAEEAIIDILVDNDLLIFNREEIIAAVRALQTKKRRHLGTLQPLLACFFQLIFVQSNAVQQITLILGGCIIIDSEPFADSTELVKHFNSSRDIRLISISIKTPFPKNVRARTVPWPKIFNS